MEISSKHYGPARYGTLYSACRAVLLVFALAPYSPTSLAQKSAEVSLAAERRAGWRAIAAMNPDEKVRNPDYLAGKFLPPAFWFFGLLTNDYTSTKTFIDAQQISAYYMANAVTQHIDGILQNIAERDVKQVVHIGAGLDSRPYRFGKRMPGVRFFELDQRGTQTQKKKMVRAVFGELPANVTYTDLDYRTKPIFDTLRDAGYHHHLKTLFIWEGCSMFTAPDIVENNLRIIAKRSAFGSEVVFDYVFDALVKGDFSKYQGARYEAVESEVKGEPWRFGIAEGKATEFLAQRGLDMISDLGAGDLADRYLVKSDGTLDGMPTPYYRIIHAVVRK